MRRALVSSLIVLASVDAGPSAQAAEDQSIRKFLQAVEMAVSTTGHAEWASLLSQNADRAAAVEFFAAMVAGGITRAVVRERDRVPLLGALPGEGHTLIVDVFTEMGPRGRITTWRLDVRRPRDTDDPQPWRVVDQERLASIEGLHRLTLNPQKQYAARDLVLRSVDLELRLASGDLFVAETDEGATAVVMLGDGTMSFAPTPAEERGQVRLFAGSETIATSFSAAYLRLSPFDFDQQVKGQTVTPTGVDGRSLRRAQGIFDEEVGKSFSLDLYDLSRDNWSLVPQVGDFLAEVRTRRYDTLTFARSTSEAEDVSLFHRQRKRNISVYASEMKLSSRGRFYNEDELVEYDVLDYNIDATFAPDRGWLDGRTRLKIRVRSFALAALTLRLAEEFNVHSITTDEFGRLMFLRVRNQNNIVLNLPNPVPRDAELTLHIAYSGPIRSQDIDQETLGAQGGRAAQRSDDLPYVPPEPNWLFSNRSHWYPQNQVTDYASATIRFTVPAEYTVVASGVHALGSPVAAPAAGPGMPTRATYVYSAAQPVRYLGVMISKFTQVDRATVALEIVPREDARPLVLGGQTLPAVGVRNTVDLVVEANRRQQDRGRDIVDTAAEILRFYASLVGDAPYESMTIAMVEHERPGGHAPGYFAVLNNPLPVTPFAFRNDPATFTSFPEFYIAHELAHQWWGQAVGWKNYHEQWLSEGVAQYFAALYAKERRGEATFRDVLKQLRRWAMDQSDQGAVYLGYRLGHIKGDSRVFRALVYNKGAAVLHMLRRLVGDEVFFRGVRRYYAENRYRKAGTEDLQRAMEEEAGRSLQRFFDRWIYQSGLPRVQYSVTTDGQDVILRFDQAGEVYDVPVLVTITTSDKTIEEVVPITEARVERRIPHGGASVRSVDVNGDHGSLGDFSRR